MKTKTTLTLLILFTPLFILLNLSAQGPIIPDRPKVRLIYFVPSDKSIDQGGTPVIGQGWDERIRNLMVKTQSLYEREMEEHEFVDASGKGKTFLLERDQDGVIVVHKIHGNEDAAKYRENPENIENELFFYGGAPFSAAKEDIYLIFVETDEFLTSDSKVCGQGIALHHDTGPFPFFIKNPAGLFGIATVAFNDKCIADSQRYKEKFDTVIQHELGHAFGLRHDFRDDPFSDVFDKYVMRHPSKILTNNFGTKLSELAAEWLNHHRAFNEVQGPLNSNTTFIRNNPKIPGQVSVMDTDGIGSVQVIKPVIVDHGADESLIGGQSEKTANNFGLIFDPTSVSTKVNGNDININMNDKILLQAIDKHGNITRLKNVALNDLPDKNVGLLIPKVVLTEVTLAGGTVSLELTGANYTANLSTITQALSVDGIKGVTIDTDHVERKSDKKITVTLDFDGTDFDKNASLTFSVAADAIANYTGDELTADISVTARKETLSVITVSPLTEATLDESVVTLTLTGAAYEPDISKITNAVMVSGIKGVSVETTNIERISDRRIKVALNFDGTNFYRDKPLTFSVDAGAITNYKGAALTVEISVTASRDESLLTLFWTDTSTDKIQRVNLDGSNVEDLITRTRGLSDARDIALDFASGKIYWTDAGKDKIQRANLDGSDVEDLVTQGLRSPRGIALDVAGGKMYWTDISISSYSMKKIKRANLDGSDVEDLVTRTQGLRSPNGIALDVEGAKMYWTDYGTEKIQRANLDGTNVEDLVSIVWSPRGIALDVAGGKMYWTDTYTDIIQRANLDGSNVENLVTQGLKSPTGIALDVAGGKMYWTDTSTDKIQRANLDGSNVEDLVTQGLKYPTGIAIGIITPVNPKILKGDVNRDNVVDFNDLVIISLRYGQTGSDNSADVNGDKIVNVDDLILVAAEIDNAAAAPAARAKVQSHFTEAQLQQWLTEARATGNTSHTYQKGIAVLKQLLALVAAPKTVLLPNYPNPFNPETWIPYQLAKSADVSITIYAADGTLVRKLDLGHQPVGMYQSRNCAAYWDGKNAVGEPVASGVYFYTLTAEDFTATRKMLILK